MILEPEPTELIHDYGQYVFLIHMPSGHTGHILHLLCNFLSPTSSGKIGFFPKCGQISRLFQN